MSFPSSSRRSPLDGYLYFAHSHFTISFKSFPHLVVSRQRDSTKRKYESSSIGSTSQCSLIEVFRTARKATVSLFTRSLRPCAHLVCPSVGPFDRRLVRRLVRHACVKNGYGFVSFLDHERVAPFSRNHFIFFASSVRE